MEDSLDSATVYEKFKLNPVLKESIDHFADGSESSDEDESYDSYSYDSYSYDSSESFDEVAEELSKQRNRITEFDRKLMRDYRHLAFIGKRHHNDVTKFE